LKFLNYRADALVTSVTAPHGHTHAAPREAGIIMNQNVLGRSKS